MAGTSIGLASQVKTQIYFDEPTNACWFGALDGKLRSFRILGGAFRDFGGGWTSAVAVFPSVDGLAVFIVEASGDLLAVARDRANHADAQTVLSIGTPVVAAQRLTNGDILALDASGRVHRLEPRLGTATVLTTAVAGARLLAVDQGADELAVAVPGPASELHRFKLADGSAIGAPASVPFTINAVSAAPRASGLLLVDDAGVISLHDWSGQIDPFTVAKPGTSALCCWHSLVIAATPAALELVEWGDDVQDLPLAAGFDPLVPGGWAPLVADYAAAGLSPDGVGWRIEEGTFAGSISVARPVTQSAGKYEHRVLAGPGASEFQVTAFARSAGTVLATRRFRVIRHWPDSERGPPMCITGAQTVWAKPGWGGGPAGPQNINAHPAPEELRVAVAVFRTKGATSAVNAPGRVAQLKADMIGSGLSVKTYYEEVSYRATPASPNPAHPKGTAVTLLGDQVFGPIDVDYAWADLFEPSDAANEWASWNPKGDTWDILAGTFSTFLLDRGLADTVTMRADSVLLTVLPGTDDPVEVAGKKTPAQWTWAFAGDAQVYWKGDTWTTFKRVPAVVMPAALPANIPDPWVEAEFVSTMIHELGHNLGCPDLYNKGDFPAETAGREVGAWDIMNEDVPLSHFSLAHRMRLGWVNPDWIEVCDFGKNPASRSVTLHAIEAVTRSGPPAGRRAGVEVRIRDGWNYYFEYRRKQTGQVGDQHLPVASAIFGTDVFQAGADDVARALILKLPLDIDGDGPILRANNEDYEESDVTNPDRMNDFRFTRGLTSPLDRNAVTVQIDYVGAHRAELQMTPAPGRGEFKSPDINLDGPAGPNIAVKGKTNTIRATVHNRGTKAADKVQIRVSWLPFTSAAGPWNTLPSPPTQAIPARSSRDFFVSWPLDASVQLDGKEAEHFCVRVDVDRYIDPLDPSGSEIVIHNNWAQSNFSTSAVGHGSPSERRTTIVNATNALRVPAVHRTVVEQSSAHFRAFVDHAWRRLDPGETDVTELSYESLAGDPLHQRDFDIAFRQSRDRGLVNDLTARTVIMPELPNRNGPLERWGVQLRVAAGLRTEIARLEARGELVRGELVRGEVWADDAANRRLVDGGPIRLAGWPRRRPGEQILIDGAVGPNGEFRVILPNGLLRLSRQEEVLIAVYYHGTPQFAPCHSRDVPLRA